MRTTSAAAVLAALLLNQGCSRQTQPAEPAVQSRACQVAITATAGGDKDIAKLQADLREGRAPARAAEQLGYRFISKARLTNDAGFYTIAEQAAGCLDLVQPGEANTLLLRGHVLHQMHRFREAEAIARRLVTLREFVLDFGLLGDVLMEQGRLADAATAYQKMIDLKPFYQSYTRAAHLRWLKGDLDGAIQMMNAAVKAASPRDPESIAWAYSRLAMYELQRGRFADAERMTAASLQYVPDYAAALLVRGRISSHKPGLRRRSARSKGRALIRFTSTWMLADALRSLNHTDEAAAVERIARRRRVAAQSRLPPRSQDPRGRRPRTRRAREAGDIYSTRSRGRWRARDTSTGIERPRRRHAARPLSATPRDRRPGIFRDAADGPARTFRFTRFPRAWGAPLGIVASRA
jgi:tetratricopeptide (TPR) repeat protein